eukprot:scaffold160975_cov24-Tisochrysis_lutea.AAC.2
MASLKAVSCSAKKGVGTYEAAGACGCARHASTVRSQCSHSGWAWQAGSAGSETTTHCRCHMTRAASTKLRSTAERVTSCRKRREKRGCGRSAHAMASVMPVRIQLSSPSGERRSLSVPGNRASTSAARTWRHSADRAPRCTASCTAISSGRVRHAEKTSAGKTSDAGSRSPADVAPSAMSGSGPPPPPSSAARCAGPKWRESASTTRSEHEQSKSISRGAPSQPATSTTRAGTYSVYTSLKNHSSPSAEGAGTPCPE